jgi:hypothetical protein
MGSLFGIHRLQPHPSAPPNAISTVSVHVLHYSTDGLMVEFRIIAANSLRYAEFGDSKRTDELWRTTCCEVFLGKESGAYVEFNLSPSGNWAAYQFNSYREGMTDLVLPFEPEMSVTPSSSHFFLYAKLPFLGDEYARLSLSAVLEEIDGTNSYWALNHPEGSPDFHHRDCFALKLSAPEQT